MYLWTPYFGSTRHFGVSIKTRFFGCHGFDVIFVIYVIAKLSITKALNTNASDQATKCWAHARSDPNIFRSITDLYPQKKKWFNQAEPLEMKLSILCYFEFMRIKIIQNTLAHMFGREHWHTRIHTASVYCIVYTLHALNKPLWNKTKKIWVRTRIVQRWCVCKSLGRSTITGLANFAARTTRQRKPLLCQW